MVQRVYVETTVVSYLTADPSRDLVVAAHLDGGDAVNWSDPIVDEVRRARDAYAARFNYDLRAIYRDLKEQERRSGRPVVSCPEGATAVVTTPPGTTETARTAQ